MPRAFLAVQERSGLLDQLFDPRQEPGGWRAVYQDQADGRPGGHRHTRGDQDLAQDAALRRFGLE
jgi:hypothetical protein